MARSLPGFPQVTRLAVRLSDYEDGDAPRPLNLMTHHGEVIRHPSVLGNVFLSRLTSGSSRILALAPSVRFVLQGEEYYNIDGRLRRVRAGEFILVEAGTDSDARIPTTSETIGLCIYLPSTPSGLVEADIGSPVIFGGGADPFAQALDRFARQAVCGANVDSNWIARAAARGAEEFLARFHERRKLLRHSRPAARTEVLHRLERARAFIHGNADRTITLEDVCREAALSRFHLTRMFSEVYGVPPQSYHRQLRLDLAAIRLQHRLATPSAIARELGYGSLSAFSRAFRSRFGFPPSQQRSR